MGASPRYAQQDFSLGEFSPGFFGRISHPYYFRGARLMENTIPKPQGGAEWRPGTLYCDQMDDDRNYVIFPFVYGDNTSILILVSESDIRLYQVDPGVSFPLINVERFENEAEEEVLFSSPYSGISDLREIQAFQYRRTMFFAHPDFMLYKLEMGDEGEFTFEQFVPSYAVWVSSNEYEPGNVVAYDGELFTPLDSIPAESDPPVDSGGWWVEVGDATPGLSNIPAWTSGNYAHGDLVVHNERIWKASKWIEFFKAVDPGRPPERPQNDDSSGEWYPLGNELPAGTTSINLWASGTTYTSGVIIYLAIGKLYRSLQDGNTGNDPSESTLWKKIGPAPSFNESDWFPSLVAVHEDRLAILGSNAHPDSIFTSRTGRFDEMTLGNDADDAIQFSLGGASGERIAWARSKDALYIGTGRSEWKVSGADGGPLTPTSHVAYIQTNAGGARNGAVDIGDMLVFLQAGGRRLLRFVFSNDQRAYATPDMALFSEHVFAPGVKQMALQTNPDFILWMVMGDGTLVSATYNPAEGVFGWARHNTDGEVFSIAVTPTGDGEDDIWLFVKRTVDEVDYYLLEKFAPRRQENQSDWTYVDCAVHLDITDSEITIENAFHLQELEVLQDGARHQNITPEGSLPATVTLNSDGTKAVIGIPYTAKLRPSKVVPEDGELDTSVRVSRLGIQLYKTLGLKVGANEEEGRFEECNFERPGALMGYPPEPFTGEFPIGIDHDPSDPDWILIKKDGPFPGRILGVVYKLDMGRNS